jgi:hypothetical protein
VVTSAARRVTRDELAYAYRGVYRLETPRYGKMRIVRQPFDQSRSGKFRTYLNPCLTNSLEPADQV